MGKRRKKRERKKGFLIFFIVLILIGIGVYIWFNHEDVKKFLPEKVKITKKLKIVDEDSKSRPIAVMINNNHAAWPHAGLQDA